MKILVTGAWTDAASHIDEIKKMGHEVYFMQQESDKLPIPAEEIKGVIGNGIFLHHPISEFPNLRFVQLTSAGYDRVDMKYIEDHGIEIYNARGVYSTPIAETVIASLLDYYRGISTFAKNQDLHEWEKCRNLGELAGGSVTIVGCGSVGTEIAKRLKAFDCKVRGLDIAPYKNKYFDKMKSLDKAQKYFSKSDIVIATAPLTEETKHMFNDESFGWMKEGVVFVNVARGGLVDEEALISAIKAGKIAHAALDVFETEPLSRDSKLWRMKEVSVMPHNSFVGSGNADRLWKVIKRNLG